MSPNNFFQNLMKNKNGKSINPKLIILLIIGICLMLISNFCSDKNQAIETISTLKNATEKSNEVSADEYTTEEQSLGKNALEKSYETELQRALEQMSGVSNVTVIVKLESTERNIVEKDYQTTKKKTSETDKDSGKRDIDETTSNNKVVIIKDGNKEVPLIIEKDMPAVSGVLVVAEGVEKVSVKAKVIEAVTRVFSVPSHKVAVMEK